MPFRACLVVGEDVDALLSGVPDPHTEVAGAEIDAHRQRSSLISHARRNSELQVRS